MIANWMVYCSLCALGLTAAAALAERLLLAGRAPVRGVWIAALMLSIGIPIAAFRISSSRTPVEIAPLTVTAPTDGLAAMLSAVNVLPPSPAIVGTIPRAHTWAAIFAERLGQLDSPLMIAWVVLSAALAISFLAGVGGLAWMRRQWEQRVVQDVPVYVSRRTGPAIVGVKSPAIVVPEWALTLPADQLSLMLRHEREHLAARDGQLLIAAQLALIAMPWNAALWWQVLSLRVAIEMDCDARVLRVADARSYGELLLEVARPHRAFKLAGMIAFAERAAQLERRIRFLKRHRVPTSRRAAATASMVGFVALSAAWVAPHPAVPPHEIVRLAAATSLPVVAMHDAALSTMTVPRIRLAAPLKRANVARVRTVACANDTTVVGSTYRFIYAGMTLSRDNESKACELLTRLVDEQLAEDAVAQAGQLALRNQRMAVQSQRNAALSSLLTTDQDRTTFAANVARTANAGGVLIARGRIGGGQEPTALRNVPDEPGRVYARGGRAGWSGAVTGDTIVMMNRRDTLRAKLEQEAAMIARAGGRVEATMRTRLDSTGTNVVTRLSVDTLTPEVRERLTTVKAAVEDVVTYASLLQGIELDANAADAAKKIIHDAQEAMTSLGEPPRPGTRLRVNRERGVAMIVAGADTPLIELAPTPADRERVRSRLVTAQQ
jgi:beta-lactamase regulating signal transducer with metallopeptidase domain